MEYIGWIYHFVVLLCCFGTAWPQACSEGDAVAFTDYGGAATVYYEDLGRWTQITCCVSAPASIASAIAVAWFVDGTEAADLAGKTSASKGTTYRLAQSFACEIRQNGAAILRRNFVLGTESDFTETSPRCPSVPTIATETPLRFIYEDHNDISTPYDYLYSDVPQGVYAVVRCCPNTLDENVNITWIINDEPLVTVSPTSLSSDEPMCLPNRNFLFDLGQVLVMLSRPEVSLSVITCQVHRGTESIQTGTEYENHHDDRIMCRNPPALVNINATSTDTVELSFTAGCLPSAVSWLIFNEQDNGMEPLTEFSCLTPSSDKEYRPSFRFTHLSAEAEFKLEVAKDAFNLIDQVYCLRTATPTSSGLGFEYSQSCAYKTNIHLFPGYTEDLVCGSSSMAKWYLDGAEIANQAAGILSISVPEHEGVVTCEGADGSIRGWRVITLSEACPADPIVQGAYVQVPWGTTAEVTCDSNDTVAWFLNGKEIEGETTSTFQVMSPEHAGVVTCEMLNGTLAAWHVIATEGYCLPVDFTVRANVQLLEGSTVTIRCDGSDETVAVWRVRVITGQCPPLTEIRETNLLLQPGTSANITCGDDNMTTWFLNGSALPTATPNGPGASLLVTASDHQGVVTCEGSEGFSRTWHIIAVDGTCPTVADTLYTYIHLKPGESAEVMCSSNVVTAWFVNGNEIVNETSSILSLTASDHEGIVTCQGSDGLVSIWRVRVVRGYCPPLSETQGYAVALTDKRSCNAPANVTYCCARGATGMAWTYNGQPYEGDRLEDGQVLVGVKPGVYECRAYTDFGDSASSFTIIGDEGLNGDATTEIVSVEYVEGEPTNLFCNIESQSRVGAPVPDYSWRFNEYPINEFTTINFNTSLSGLHLIVPKGLNGRFSCSSDNCAESQITKTFVVEDFACEDNDGTGDTNQTNIISEGFSYFIGIPSCDSVTFKCCAKDVGKITWYYNGVAMPSGATGALATEALGLSYRTESAGQVLVLTGHLPGEYTCTVEGQRPETPTESISYTLPSEGTVGEQRCTDSCRQSDALVTIPQETMPKDQYVRKGDTVHWSCTVRNACRFEAGFYGFWDIREGPNRWCTINIKFPSTEQRCGNPFMTASSCELHDLDVPFCDSRFSGKQVAWRTRYALYHQINLTIENITEREFGLDYRCRLYHTASDKTRSEQVQLIDGDPPVVVTEIAVDPALAVGIFFAVAIPIVLIVAVILFLFYWPLKLFFMRCFRKPLQTRYHSFLCYSDKESAGEHAAVTLFAGTLEGHGFSICIPPRDYLLGHAQADEIGRSLLESSSLLAVVTGSFVETGWCDLALDLALKTNLPVVIILYEIEVAAWEDYQTNRLRINLRYQPGVTIIRWPSRQASKANTGRGFLHNLARDKFWYQLRSSLPNYSLQSNDEKELGQSVAYSQDNKAVIF